MNRTDWVDAWCKAGSWVLEAHLTSCMNLPSQIIYLPSVNNHIFSGINEHYPDPSTSSPRLPEALRLVCSKLALVPLQSAVEI